MLLKIVLLVVALISLVIVDVKTLKLAKESQGEMADTMTRIYVASLTATIAIFITLILCLKKGGYKYF
jgi:hypothetical protein